ncbi:MAG: hypothetical protein P8163_20485 [Candidatus Thiodiazotropha sp.]
MNYLPKEKIGLHLKLGRDIYQFVKIGQYFGSNTFEYLTLSKKEGGGFVKLIQVLDYMYSYSPSMDEFETVEELEGECESKYSGTLEECLNWANESYNCSVDRWSLDVMESYLGDVEEEILGQGNGNL